MKQNLGFVLNKQTEKITMQTVLKIIIRLLWPLPSLTLIVLSVLERRFEETQLLFLVVCISSHI